MNAETGGQTPRGSARPFRRSVLTRHVVVEPDRGPVLATVDGALIGKGIHERQTSAPVAPYHRRAWPPPTAVADLDVDPLRHVVVGGLNRDVAGVPPVVGMLGGVGQG